MPIVTIVYGVLLGILGVAGYFLTGAKSVTALIPLFFGIPFVILGSLALKESFLKHTMHAAAMLALLAIVGSAWGFVDLPKVFAGTAERPAAVISKSVMAGLSILFLALCIKSFIDVRRARNAAEGGQ